MALDLLGDTLDIHAGGIDLVFPHHEDEIAQSEAATGKPFARVWAHGAFLLTDGTKMAKRLGNVSTVKDIRESNISAAAIRHFMFTAHYRKELNLTEDGLEASMAAVRRLGDFADRLAAANAGTLALAALGDALVTDAEAALFDDLNAPEAMAALFVFVHRANAELDRGGADADALAHARAAFDRINGVLDVVPDRRVEDAALAAWVEERLAARRVARAARDFAASDAIRDDLRQRGIAIEDTSAGTKWKVVG
jgi:cysteinyl-tRNA synthetase